MWVTFLSWKTDYIKVTGQNPKKSVGFRLYRQRHLIDKHTPVGVQCRSLCSNPRIGRLWMGAQRVASSTYRAYNRSLFTAQRVPQSGTKKFRAALREVRKIAGLQRCALGSRSCRTVSFFTNQQNLPCLPVTSGHFKLTCFNIGCIAND